MARRPAVLLAALTAALTLAACGGDEEPAAESIPAPPKLTVPGENEAPELPDTGTTGEDGATGTSTTTSTTPSAAPAPSGGTQAPATGGPPADTPENDQAPPQGSPAEKFEEFCSENPGAC